MAYGVGSSGVGNYSGSDSDRNEWGLKSVDLSGLSSFAPSYAGGAMTTGSGYRSARDAALGRGDISGFLSNTPVTSQAHPDYELARDAKQVARAMNQYQAQVSRDLLQQQYQDKVFSGELDLDSPMNGGTVKDVFDALSDYDAGELESLGVDSPSSWDKLGTQSMLGALWGEDDKLGPDEAERMAEERGYISRDAYGNPIASMGTILQPVGLGLDAVNVPGYVGEQVFKQVGPSPEGLYAGMGAMGAARGTLRSMGAPESKAPATLAPSALGMLGAQAITPAIGPIVGATDMMNRGRVMQAMGWNAPTPVDMSVDGDDFWRLYIQESNKANRGE